MVVQTDSSDTTLHREPLIPVEALEAMRQEHRLELAKLRMQVIRYRELLIDNNIEPPDYDDEELLEMWRGCRAVISTASHFVANLRSAQELLK